MIPINVTSQPKLKGEGFILIFKACWLTQEIRTAARLLSEKHSRNKLRKVKNYVIFSVAFEFLLQRGF